MFRTMMVSTVVLLMVNSSLQAQSSSLYLPIEGQEVPAFDVHHGSTPTRLSQPIAHVSLTAVKPPTPRRFAIHDLITIVVRESTENDSTAALSTSKENKIDGKVDAFVDLSKLHEFSLGAVDFTNVGKPEVKLNYKNEFDGDGSAKRKDTFTTRVTARVIDVKPNGTLVVEARKFIQSDKESLKMTLTGTCRAEDVGIDNTVLSTQLFDLNLVKEHKGELRQATKKGVLTKAFEFLFNF